MDLTAIKMDQNKSHYGLSEDQDWIAERPDDRVLETLSADLGAFSELMKMKVKQYQMIKKIEGDAQRLEDEKAARCIDLRDLAEGTALPARIVDLFQQARDRIIALTPSRRDLRDETSDSMSDDTWEELLRGGTASGPGKKAFQSLVDFIIGIMKILVIRFLLEN